MTYEAFKEAMITELEDLLGWSGIEITEQKVLKVNRELDAVALRPVGSNAAPQLYLNDLYRDHERGRDVATSAGEVAAAMERQLESMPEYPEMSHDYLTRNLYLSVMNREMNGDYLSDIPFQEMEDLAVVPRVMVADAPDGVSSCVVTRDMMEAYGFSEKELFDTARANMDTKEYLCRSLEQMILGPVFGDVPPEPGAMAYVLTNLSGIDGAAAILSDKAMAQARREVGEDFFILPSSRHEVILVPRSSPLSVGELADMVKSVNQTVLEREDLLSDHIYRYNSRQGTIRMIEPKDRRPVMEQTMRPAF